MRKSVTQKTKDAIVDAAQRGAEGVKTIAGEALGAATKAAAGVVFESTVNALEAGRAKLKQSTPAMKKALGNAAKRTVNKPAARKASTARKARTARKTTNKRRSAKTKRSIKRRSR